MNSRYQLWRLERTPLLTDMWQSNSAGQQAEPAWAARGYDAAYIPRAAFTTGHVDTHDVGVEADGRVVFVNTSFGCLATVSQTASFKVVWQPPFLSELVNEDRCHLNGLAIRDGRAAYVTAVSESDVADGWRDRRRDGGVVVDVRRNEVIARGLSMPHSPRWHDGRLWVLNSGRGEFGYIDLTSGRFEPVAFCPGYLRGLTFAGNYAVVTLSKPRHHTFQGLELDARLSSRHADAQCGLQIIDLTTGAIAYWLRVESNLMTELYDVVALCGTRQPMALGFQNSEIERVITIE